MSVNLNLEFFAVYSPAFVDQLTLRCWINLSNRDIRNAEKRSIAAIYNDSLNETKNSSRFCVSNSSTNSRLIYGTARPGDDV